MERTCRAGGTRLWQLLCAAGCALALALGASTALAAPALAEEGQGGAPAGQQVVLGVDSSKPVEVGGYYFKAAKDNHLKYSATKNGTYTKTEMYSQQAIVESSVAYYIYYKSGNSTRYLKKYDLEKQRTATIAKLSRKADNVAALYDGQLYINYSDYDSFGVSVRIYNLNANKMRSGSIANTAIQAASGEYVSYVDALHTDVSPYRLYLGRLSSNGTIEDGYLVAKRAYASRFIDGTLWFNSYKLPDMTGTMYIKTVSTENGIAAKPAPSTVRTHKSSKTLFASDFEGSTYVIFIGTKTYRVNAATGAKTRITIK